MERVLVFPYSDLTFVHVSGPCTLVVTPVSRSDSSFFPVGIPAPPYPTSGVFTWRAIYHAAVGIRHLCLEISRQPEAGIVWLDTTSIARRPNPRGLAIMFYATNSVIDHVIGPEASDGLVLPGMNVNSTS